MYTLQHNGSTHTHAKCTTHSSVMDLLQSWMTVFMKIQCNCQYNWLCLKQHQRQALEETCLSMPIWPYYSCNCHPHWGHKPCFKPQTVNKNGWTLLTKSIRGNINPTWLKGLSSLVSAAFKNSYLIQTSPTFLTEKHCNRPSSTLMSNNVPPLNGHPSIASTLPFDISC